MRLWLNFGATFGLLHPTYRVLWIGLRRFLLNWLLTHDSADAMTWDGNGLEAGLSGSGAGVGRGNKFVLLDMTEEPEAKKAYSIQHKRKFNGMLR